MILRNPDFISIYAETFDTILPGSETVQAEDASVRLVWNGDLLNVYVRAENSPLKYIRLHWNFRADERRMESLRVLGDEWECNFGTMEWRGIVPQRGMPWACAVTNGNDVNIDVSGRFTECFGVKVRPGALCFWQYTTQGVTLWLDVRNGGSGVLLQGRELKACEIVFGEYRDMTAFRAIRAFYGRLCTDRLVADHKIYGSNNWYYAYGRSSHEDILADTRIIADLCQGFENRPYMVIDDGWQQNSTDGPWDKGNERFPDMKGLADEMKKMGVRPGIWVRVMADMHHGTEGILPEYRFQRNEKLLDPSHPAVLEKIREDVHRCVIDWGYELIKQDYTTYDLFGYYGFERPTALAEDGWHFYDRTRTSAEIAVNLYRTIYEATEGKAVIIGCNAVSFLTAGLCHLNRTGGDTNGWYWERTRKMGVNTLAFRMMHDQNLYAADADCVGYAGKIAWERNYEWLRALAVSGSPLFVSIKPGVLNEEELQEIRKALHRNSIQEDVLEPIDWMDNNSPERWLLNGEPISFNWYPDNGIHSFPREL